MGAGKTAVLGEASDILAQRDIVHAAIDVDALGLAHLPAAPSNNNLMYENLRCICANYAAQGVERFLLARAIEDEAELSRIRQMIPAATPAVCRLTASIEEMSRRVGTRETGLMRANYLARVQELNDILDRGRLENFTVSNENRPVTGAALELLVKAGWISS